MRIKLLYQIVTLLTVSLFSFNSVSQSFIKNMGQVVDENNKHVNNVHFTVEFYNSSIFFTQNGPVYYFQQYQPSEYLLIKQGTKKNTYTDEEWEKIELAYETKDVRNDLFYKTQKDGYRIDLNFENANFNNYVGEDPLKVQSDFYINENTKGIRGIESFNKIRYVDIYPGIDIIYYIKDGKLKYDLELKGDADITNLKFSYIGASNHHLDKDGNLIVTTGIGEIIETAPVSFQNGQKITSQFVIKNNKIEFKLGKDYIQGIPLLIDPTVTWATHINDNSGNTSFVTSHPQWDSQANMYVNFSTYNLYTFPTITPGGTTYHQNVSTSSTGLTYIIQKFNANRELVWCTYFGGNGGAHVGFGNRMIAVDNNDGIVIVGRITNHESTPNFPLLNSGGGAYYETNLGASRSFVARFNASGALTWSTMLNSINSNSTSMGLQSISVDNSNNIIIAGYCYTGSSWGEIPAVNPGGGAYFKNKAATVEAQAPVMFKFSPSNVLIWGTYISQGNAGQYHGSGEPGHIIDVDANNNLFSTFQVSMSSNTHHIPGRR